VADQTGCLDWSEYTACAEGFCEDEFVCGGCVNPCTMGASECVLASGMIRYCEPNQHGCLVWGGYSGCEDGFCENETTCGTCQNACSPEGAIACADGDYRICIADDNGCLIWGPDQACDQGACASTELCLECFDLDQDGHNAVGAACPAGDDNCDDDPGNWTASGCANCVDNDGDLYGADCDIGPDWDDEDDSVWGPYPFCGDGDVDPGEACDDGANVDNDGCSGECDVESGYICQGEPSDCTYEDAVVIYVDDDAPAGGDGTRWNRAFDHLSLGLTAAANALNTYSRVEIWVGQGTYSPYPEQRASAFDLMDNLSLYGGFDGNMHHSLSQRDWEQYPTILSGDIGTQGLQDDNVYHVLRANGVNNNCSLDGFSIRDGYAEDNNDELGRSGAGLLSENSQLTLRECTFTGNLAGLSGGGVHNISGNLSLTNCTFTDNSGAGGGISNLNGAVNVTNCTFSDNHSDTNGGGASSINGELNMTDCSFTDNDSDDNGGGIFTTSGNLNLENCSFLRNETNSYASFGGGVYSNNSYIDLAECTFTSNETRGRGAGIYAENGTLDISDCQFNSNKISCWSDDFCTGAGICRLDGSLVVSDSSLHGNQITRGSTTTKRGGGLYMANGTAELHSTDFQANHMLATLPSGNQEYTGSGGGLYAAADSEISLFDCTFTNNNAVDGGGIYLFVDTNLEAHGCSFTGNRADPNGFDGRGGAIYHYHGSQLITGCLFENNSSTGIGGAVYIFFGRSTHIRNKFVANHSQLRGGAIYSWRIEADYSGPEIINCLFSGNSVTSSRGGGIYFSETTPLLTNCLFSANSASVSGGGVYLTESNAILTNCTFSRNTADIGCGLFADNSTATIENSIFWNASDGLLISGTVAEDISVSYSCVDGGYTGEGNIDFCEPAFIDEDGPDDPTGEVTPGDRGETPSAAKGENRLTAFYDSADMIGILYHLGPKGQLYFMDFDSGGWEPDGDPCPGTPPYDLAGWYDPDTDTWGMVAVDGKGALWHSTDEWYQITDPLGPKGQYALAAFYDNAFGDAVISIMDPGGSLYLYNGDGWDAISDDACPGKGPFDLTVFYDYSDDLYWTSVVDSTGKAFDFFMGEWVGSGTPIKADGPFRISAFHDIIADIYIFYLLDGDGVLFVWDGDDWENTGAECPGKAPFDLDAFYDPDADAYFILAINSTGKVYQFTGEDWEQY